MLTIYLWNKVLRHVKSGGYLFFIIPNGLFESEQAKKLHEFFKETVDIQGIIQLPENHV